MTFSQSKRLKKKVVVVFLCPFFCGVCTPPPCTLLRVGVCARVVVVLSLWLLCLTKGAVYVDERLILQQSIQSPLLSGIPMLASNE